MFFRCSFIVCDFVLRSTDLLNLYRTQRSQFICNLFDLGNFCDYKN
ncbi:hypothetical protein CKA32_003744 [Geitlerinema sp. FC II]|nr:hypothetical protein CKA32_003744 [Geitlerinema sp. FC II]